MESLFHNPPSRIFDNRAILDHAHRPGILWHREKEIREIARAWRPAVQEAAAQNLILYGMPGTGKTVTAEFVAEKLQEASNYAKVVVLNGNEVRSYHRAMTTILSFLHKDALGNGLPQIIINEKFIKYLNSNPLNLIVIIDEVDRMDEADALLYFLSRVGSQLRRSTVSITCIANSVRFVEDQLDGRTISSLRAREKVFSPYDASQLQDILKDRAKAAFKVGALSPEVIPLIAALASQDGGDARRAIDLLRAAGDAADDAGTSKVNADHVETGWELLDRDRVQQTISRLSTQSKAILTMFLTNGKREYDSSGEAFEAYKAICRRAEIRPIEARRFLDLVTELDCVGLLQVMKVNRGRHGVTRVLRMDVLPEQVAKALQSDPDFSSLVSGFDGGQKTLSTLSPPSPQTI